MPGLEATIKKIKQDHEKNGGTILVLNQPEDVHELDELSYDVFPAKTPYQAIFSFTFSLAEMAQVIEQTVTTGRLAEQGMLFLVYPKKGNKRFDSWIGRDDIFPYLHVSEETGYVGDTVLKFNSMASFNEHLTVVGLRHLPGKPVKTSGVSQRVEDYAARVPDLRSYLADKPAILPIFDSLAPGYQKDWARHVFSAQTQATREKRLLEMVEILGQGYKTYQLYRQAK
jgi:hypothetical protein